MLTVTAAPVGGFCNVPVPLLRFVPVLMGRERALSRFPGLMGTFVCVYPLLNVSIIDPFPLCFD